MRFLSLLLVLVLVIIIVRLLDEEKLLTLSILDEKAFWSVSRYMVIQVR